MDETSVLWRSAQPMLISFRPIGWWITRFLKPETFTCIWAAVVFAVPCHYWTWTWGCRVTDFWWKTGFRQIFIDWAYFQIQFWTKCWDVAMKKTFSLFFFPFSGFGHWGGCDFDQQFLALYTPIRLTNQWAVQCTFEMVCQRKSCDYLRWVFKLLSRLSNSSLQSFVHLFIDLL